MPINLKSKKGTSLVEVIVAMLILAIVVLAVVGSLGFSRRSILTENVKDDYAAQAQAIADTLIEDLSSASSATETGVVIKTPDINALQNHSGAVCTNQYGEEFRYQDGEKQFKFTAIKNTITGEVTGYQIRVAVYYENGKRSCTLTAFANPYGSAFYDGTVSSQ